MIGWQEVKDSLNEIVETHIEAVSRHVDRNFNWLSDKYEVSWIVVQVILGAIIVFGVFFFFAIAFPLIWLNEAFRTTQRFYRRAIPCKGCTHSQFLHSYEEAPQNGGGKKPMWLGCQALTWRDKKWFGRNIVTCTCIKYEPMTNLEYIKTQK